MLVRINGRDIMTGDLKDVLSYVMQTLMSRSRHQSTEALLANLEEMRSLINEAVPTELELATREKKRGIQAVQRMVNSFVHYAKGITDRELLITRMYDFILKLEDMNRLPGFRWAWSKDHVTRGNAEISSASGGQVV